MTLASTTQTGDRDDKNRGTFCSDDANITLTLSTSPDSTLLFARTNVQHAILRQALGAFSELEEEVCKQEAVSIVAETMAPFEDHLLHLQRQKDVSAIQVLFLDVFPGLSASLMVAYFPG